MGNTQSTDYYVAGCTRSPLSIMGIHHCAQKKTPSYMFFNISQNNV